MNIDPHHEYFSSIELNDKLQPLNEKFVRAIGPKEELEKLQKQLRRVGYRKQNKHFNMGPMKP